MSAMVVLFLSRDDIGWPSASSVAARLYRFPQSVHIAHRGDAEEAFVLPIKVGDVLIPHAKDRTGRVEGFAQQEAARLQKSQPLLIL